MTHSITANNENGDPTISLILTVPGTFQIKQGYHICSELLQDQLKTLLD